MMYLVSMEVYCIYSCSSDLVRNFKEKHFVRKIEQKVFFFYQSKLVV